MTMTITIEGRQLGSRRRLFPEREIPYPTDSAHLGGQSTLREFIDYVVRREVAAFRQRQEERSLFRVLTERQIARGAAQGKVDPGGRKLAQEVDEDAAVATALQAFEDGLFFVFVDDAQREDLDAPLFVGPESRVTFVRLVALAGG